MSEYQYMHPAGRTMHDASVAEDSYRLMVPEFAAPYWPCGTAGIPELIRATQTRFPKFKGRTFEIQRVLRGSSIGCMIVEDAGKVTI